MIGEAATSGFWGTAFFAEYWAGGYARRSSMNACLGEPRAGVRLDASRMGW